MGRANMRMRIVTLTMEGRPNKASGESEESGWVIFSRKAESDDYSLQLSQFRNEPKSLFSVCQHMDVQPYLLFTRHKWLNALESLTMTTMYSYRYYRAYTETVGSIIYDTAKQ